MASPNKQAKSSAQDGTFDTSNADSITRFTKKARTSDQRPPVVVISDRQDSDIVRDYIAAIHRQNDKEPFIFSRDGLYVRIYRDVTGRAQLQQVTVEVLLNILKDVARTIIRDGEKPVNVRVPKAIAVHILTEPDCLFPAIRGVKYVPFYREDGSICSKPGYDSASGYYYDPIDDQLFAAIPGTQESAKIAVAHLYDLVSDFPFASDTDRANFLALAITMVVQGTYSGRAPVACLDAISDAGTGKGLLTDIIHLIATGERFYPQTMPEDNAEMRKLLTAVAIKSDPILAFDNIRGVVKSTALEAFVTAPAWQDRVLGSNRNVKLPVDTIVIMNGNRLQLGNDMANGRCYFIRLDAKMARPHTRSGYKHADIISHVKAHRTEYLIDLLTIVKAWHTADRPILRQRNVFGRFISWESMVANILLFAGVDDVFATATADMAASNNEESEWETWLQNWHTLYNDTPIKVKTIAIDIAHSGDSNEPSILAESMPSGIADVVDKMRNTDALAHKLGLFLRARKGRRYGDRQFMLEEAGRDTRTNVLMWRVVCQPETDPEPEPAPVPTRKVMTRPSISPPVVLSETPTPAPVAKRITVDDLSPEAKNLLALLPDDFRLVPSVMAATQRYCDKGQPSYEIDPSMDLDIAANFRRITKGKTFAGEQLYKMLGMFMKAKDDSFGYALDYLSRISEECK